MPDKPAVRMIATSARRPDRAGVSLLRRLGLLTPSLAILRIATSESTKQTVFWSKFR